MAFQESMTKGATVIVGNANLVKQVVFPVEVLPVKGVHRLVLHADGRHGDLAVYVLATHGSCPGPTFSCRRCCSSRRWP